MRHTVTKFQNTEVGVGRKGMGAGVKRRAVWNAGRNRNPSHIRKIGDESDNHFLRTTLESRKHWRNVFKILKEKDFQTRHKIPAKIPSSMRVE